jgi:hypothetical protein
MRENDDAVARARAAFPDLEDFALDANGVAVEHRPGESHLVPSQIADRRAERGVAHRDAHHEPQREGAVDDPGSELGVAPAILLVEMQRRRVHRQRTEEHVVGFGNGAAYRMTDYLADGEFLEIESGHDGNLGRA